MTSTMLTEARQSPALVEAALGEDHALYRALGEALRDRRPAFAATVARGSSDHAAAYAATLFGICAGRVTVDAALKSVDARAGVLNAQKSRWKRSLSEAEDQWVNWRDVECQDVAPFEAGMSAKGGDPRLACIIDRDSARVADLKARYP